MKQMLLIVSAAVLLFACKKKDEGYTYTYHLDHYSDSLIVGYYDGAGVWQYQAYGPGPRSFAWEVKSDTLLAPGKLELNAGSRKNRAGDTVGLVASITLNGYTIASDQNRYQVQIKNP